MGSARKDLLKREKKYADMFPMDTKRGVLSLLNSFNEIREKRYYEGDYDVCNLIVDLERAINYGNLTFKQKEVLHFLYVEGLTQKEISKIYGITQQAVLDRRDHAVNKIVHFNKKGF